MNDLFLRACRGEPVPRTPVWLMRQAGRYLPEYRAVRDAADFLTLCRTPELAVRVTLQPLERFELDAAILFSDILVPAAALGLEFDFHPGPVLARPVRDAADIERLALADPEEAVPYVFETLRLLRRELAGRVPLIGFAAAPFTLAAYLIEGQGSKGFDRTKRLLLSRPDLAQRLLDKVTRLTTCYLAAQIRAGAQAVQLFDSWAGVLEAGDYREFALAPARRVIDALRGERVPRIYFALDAAHLLPAIGECGADVIGVDWRVDLGRAAQLLGGRFALQGNLDPCVLLATPEVIERRALSVLDQARGLSGHVFNLGHGVLPGTPVEHVQVLLEVVRERGRRSR